VAAGDPAVKPRDDVVVQDNFSSTDDVCSIAPFEKWAAAVGGGGFFKHHC
jgi:hypothetical protein